MLRPSLYLEVAVVDAMPLIDVFGHFELPAGEVRSSELFDTAFVHIAFDLNLHGVLAVVASRGFTHLSCRLAGV
jgi:hypothetical protein